MLSLPGMLCCTAQQIVFKYSMSQVRIIWLRSCVPCYNACNSSSSDEFILHELHDNVMCNSLVWMTQIFYWTPMPPSMYLKTFCIYCVMSSSVCVVHGATWRDIFHSTNNRQCEISIKWWYPEFLSCSYSLVYAKLYHGNFSKMARV